MFTIKLAPQGQTLLAQADTNLLSILTENSIFLRTDCGGRGKCNKCQVEVTDIEGSSRKVNSCSILVNTDITILIPQSSLLSSHVMAKSPATLPNSFTCKGKKHGNIPPRYGIAADLGTTTIALYLCDIAQQTVLSSLSVKNPQSMYGDDVMSRIGAISKDHRNLQHLKKLAVNSIEWGCSELARAQEIEPNQIEKLVVVGNPAMIHLFKGVNPHSIGVAPYQPAFFEHKTLESCQLGFQQIECMATTLPQISGFLGGDILAASIAAEMDEQPPGTLLVDIGTNGELLYKGYDGIYATSCATGPAFEGATISCGIQAIPGAIEKVSIADRYSSPQYVMLKQGGAPLYPAGLCGSGVISGAAELRRTGVVLSTGSFIVDNAIEALSHSTENEKKYIISNASSNGKTVEVAISQKDIRSIQLGKAALITGIEYLLKREKRTIPEKIIVAGAFGSHLEKEDMLILGMLPPIDPQTIFTSGNLAGAGAVMVLCDESYLGQAIALASNINVVDLAGDLAFQNSFLENLAFPEKK